MAANSLFREYPTREFGLDDAFEYPLGDLDLSPEDCDLIARMNGFDTDPVSGFCSEPPWFSDFVNYDTPDNLLPGTLDNLGAFPDAGHMVDDMGTASDSVFFDPPFDCNMGNGQFQDMLFYDQPYDLTTTIRQAVEAQAAADTRFSSQKEKRRDAGIAIHLQRLQETPLADFDMLAATPDFPSPSSSFVAQGSTSPTSTGASQTATPASATTDSVSTPTLGGDQAGGVELVLDLNMNATSNLPKKHKPRSQAQRENYIKVRKHGACEKHRKQHKRVGCLIVYT